MKKLIILSLILLTGSVGFCATTQPQNVGNIQADGLALTTTKTIAQIEALTADTTNQFVVCSDCVEARVCISSGSVNPGSWIVLAATATAAIGGLLGHCK